MSRKKSDQKVAEAIAVEPQPEPKPEPTPEFTPESASEVATEPTPEPNLKFVGAKPYKLTNVLIAGTTYDLPDDQDECFYHADAALIARTFPHYYVLTSGCGCCGKKEVE